MNYKPNFASSPLEAEARKRASKALRNARQRCTNIKNPDYSNYGAKGVEVRFKTLAELIASIGLPKPGLSLDRIDPHGHYEHGNVRWASPAVQAANKKASATSYHFSEAALIEKAQFAIQQREDRKKATVAWVTMRKAFHRGYLTSQEVSSLSERLKCLGVLEANFDLNTVPDVANDAPGYIHLPALTLPSARVRLRSEPANTPQNETYLNERGRIAALEELDPKWNIPASVWKCAVAIAENGYGLVLQGKATPERLLGGWIEGACLALASSLPAGTGRTAAFFPLLKAIHELDKLGSHWSWDDSFHPLLDDDVVLIPDFVLDCGPWGKLPSQSWKIGALLNYRAERGRKTIVGVSSLDKVPDNAKELVLGGFQVMKMPAQPAHEKCPLKFAGTFWKVPEGDKTLSKIADDPSSNHLVNSYE